MAINDYTINYSSTDDASVTGAFSKPAFIIPERSTNVTDTSLILVGKYSLSSGEELQTDLVRILENHARDTPPANPTIGQTWYDTNDKLLKVYTPTPTGGRWIAVGSGSTDVSTLPIASFASLGAIKIGDPFNISEEGVLTLPDMVHISQDLIARTAAEYIFTSKVTITGELVSANPDNFILDNPELPEDWFARSFITKSYADRIYAKANTSDPEGTYVPPASSTSVGGVIVGEPFTMSDAGMLSLDNMYYNAATATNPSEYNFNANVLTSKPVYSLDGYNYIGANPAKTSAEYACFFTTKGYVEDHFIRKGDMSVVYILPPATNVELGGILAKPPFSINNLGVLALMNIAYTENVISYNNIDILYAFDTHISAKKITASQKATFNDVVEIKKDAYSADPDNFISKDSAKVPADYDNYFVTKHYADSRYFLDPNAGTTNVGVIPVVAGPNKLGGVIPGKPFALSATGELSIPNMEYTGASTVPGGGVDDTVPGGSNTPTFEFKSKVKLSGIAFSAVENNGINADPLRPPEFYDPFLTTKKFTDDNYLKTGDIYEAGLTNKSSRILEYAPGFSQSEFENNENALVNKKYVDSKTSTIGPTTPSGFPENSVITTKNGVLSSLSGLAFDAETGELKSSKASLVSTATEGGQSALTVFNDQPSSTAGSSISLCASEPDVAVLDPLNPPVAKPAIVGPTKLGAIKMGGWNGAATVTGAAIESNSTEQWSPTTNGTNLVLKVTKKGETTPSPAMIINDDKSIQIFQGFIETVNKTSNAEWTIDFTTGTIQVLTTSANTTITMPSIIDFKGRSITVVIKYTDAHTITWAGGTISWPDNNTAPIPTSATGATDVFMFFGDGTNIFGSTAGQAYVQTPEV